MPMADSICSAADRLVAVESDDMVPCQYAMLPFLRRVQHISAGCSTLAC